MPTWSTTPRTKRGPVAVLRHLGVEAQQPAQPAGRGSRRRGGAGRTGCGCGATLGITSGPTPSMTTSAWPSSSDITPVTRSMTSRCAGRGEQVEQARPVLARDQVAGPLDGLAEHRGDPARVDVDALDELVDLALEVVAQPRHGGELDPVGLLVEADPQPEVGRVGLELALGVHDVRRDEEQPADSTASGLPGERVELAEHLAGEEAEQGADLEPGDPGADRLGRARRRGAATAAPAGELVDDRVDERGEGVGVGLDPPAAGRRRAPARCRPRAVRPVKSRTRPVERARRPAARRRPRRPRRGTRPGPGRPAVVAVATAKSQSIICPLMRPSVRSARRPGDVRRRGRRRQRVVIRRAAAGGESGGDPVEPGRGRRACSRTSTRSATRDEEQHRAVAADRRRRPARGRRSACRSSPARSRGRRPPAP